MRGSAVAQLTRRVTTIAAAASAQAPKSRATTSPPDLQARPVLRVSAPRGPARSRIVYGFRSPWAGFVSRPALIECLCDRSRPPRRDRGGEIAQNPSAYAGLEPEPGFVKTGSTAVSDRLDGRLDEPRPKVLGLCETPALEGMRATLVDLKRGAHSGIHVRCGVHDDVSFSRSCPSHDPSLALPDIRCPSPSLAPLTRIASSRLVLACSLVGRMRAYPTLFVKACQGGTPKTAD